MRDTLPAGITLLYALLASHGNCPEKDLPGLLSRLLGRPAPKGWRTALACAKRRRQVFCSRAEGAPRVRLTALGRARVGLPSRRAEIPFSPAGTTFFVSYDIPTAGLRDAFRYRLRDLGWHKLHKSLWVSRRDRRAEATQAIEELGLQSHVYLGTCALLTEVARTEDRGERAALLTELAEVRSEAARTLGSAFGRAIRLTERLRSMDVPVEVDDGIRGSWREMWQAIRREAGNGGYPAAGDGGNGEGRSETVAGDGSL